MGKLTKNEVKKLLKLVRKDIWKGIKEEAKEKNGSMDPIIIDDVCIEMGVEDEVPVSKASKVKGKASKGKVKSSALTRCIYICYVIGGTRICRKICY